MWGMVDSLCYLMLSLLSEMPQVFTDIPSALDLYNPQGLQNYLKTF